MDIFTEDWAVSAGDKPTAAHWNQIGQSLNYLNDNVLMVGAEVGWVGVNDPIDGNWLVENGRAISRTDYPDLFALIGTAFGAGDGSLTFNIPDRRSSVAVGFDVRDQDYNAIGKVGGEKAHVLSWGEMPQHSHSEYRVDTTHGSGAAGGTSFGIYNLTDDTGLAGNSWAHNNMPPYVVSNTILKVQ